MIRGAGDILGPEQAGFIDTVGMDMYLSLLKETIEERQTGIKSNSKKEQNKGNLLIDAYLPSDYIEKIDKIDLYQEIDNIKSLKELDDLKNKIIDIYGQMPNEVSLLFVKREITFIIDTDPNFDKVIDGKDFVDLVLSLELSNKDGVGVLLFKALTNYLKYIKVTYTNKQIKIRVFKMNNWIYKLKDIIYAIKSLDYLK